MYRKKKTTMERGQMIFLMICLSFLLGVAGGAVAANIAGQSGKETFALFLQEHLSPGTEASYGYVVWKYLKYDLLIWLGGWLSMGVFLSGCVCLFRSISLGFTAAMMMASYGAKGVWLTAISILPQNLILIPVYIGMTTAALYYLFAWNEESPRKSAGKRERRKKRTEYCILLAASILLIAVAGGVEVGMLPFLTAHFADI